MRRALAAVVTLILVLGIGAPASAGGSAETVLVVVNGDSPLSKQVANHYVRARGIPTTHVCHLSGIPNLTVITLAQYRERILDPILAFLKEQKLEEEIDIIAFSVDFPFGVDYRADIDPKAEKWSKPPYKFHVASLTSLTYLHRNLADHAYLDLNINRYARNADYDPRTAHGFRNRYVWSKETTPATGDADAKERYLLAIMLGATGIQGNTTDEVLTCLDRAIGSDATSPKGSVYLMENKNVRATTRMGMFEAVGTQLARLVPKAVRLAAGKDGQDGILPVGKKDVIGIVAGSASFNWPKAGSTMLPGAIAEHLTSFGAKLDGSGQTKITEFIRAGAAGSSGAVAEPYAIPHKFPLPFMHGYYAEGCCLIEAFYQSMMGPYQLLVVGEPLARPYAEFAKVDVAEPDLRFPLKGNVTFKVDVGMPGGVEASTIELWIDGQLVAEGDAEEGLELDSTTLDDGPHDFRVVVVEDTRVETRSAMVGRVVVSNTHAFGATLRLPSKAVPLDDEILVKGEVTSTHKAKTVDIFHHGAVIGTAKVKSKKFRMLIPASDIGLGETTLRARITFREAPPLWSDAESLTVVAPKALKQAKKKRRRKKKSKEKPPVPAKAGQGLWCVATMADGKQHGFPMTILGKRGGASLLKQLRAKAKGKIARIQLTGEMQTSQEGLYRLAVNAAGKLTVSILGHPVIQTEESTFDRQIYAAVPLSADWHPIEIDYEPTGNGDLWIMRGGPVVSAFFEGKELRHK